MRTNFHGSVSANALLDAAPVVRTTVIGPLIPVGIIKLTWLTPWTSPGAAPALRTWAIEPLTAAVTASWQMGSASGVREAQPAAKSVRVPSPLPIHAEEAEAVPPPTLHPPLGTHEFCYRSRETLRRETSACVARSRRYAKS